MHGDLIRRIYHRDPVSLVFAAFQFLSDRAFVSYDDDLILDLVDRLYRSLDDFLGRVVAAHTIQQYSHNDLLTIRLPARSGSDP